MRKILLLSSVVCAATVIPSTAADAGHCTNATLHGKYVFTAQGTTLPALGLPVPLTGAFASSGSAEFDGHGHFTLTATSSFAGVIQGPATVPGTYSVSSDCLYTSQAANGASFRAAIVDDGREILILQTNTGVVITGTAQATGESRRGEEKTRECSRCSIEEIAGRYGFLVNGFAGGPILGGAPFGPLAGVGVVDLHADGTFTMMAQRSVDGVLDPGLVPLQGTFKMTGNCTAELVFDVGFHFTANIVNRDETVFIETDPGTAIIVRAKRI